ncbi:restriction endonuclease subunit S [Stecheria sp. CLA-KB-P133]|uniref:Restriction endonuclease subunit S n=1 Tax=Grylomicrobium aquisgranensis TaxID=2926318 RepID=A0AB35U0P8_9FIRM|nr:restriction endonuclease subunit S [Stecheria sp. CLA-KB-P133]
MRTETCTLGDIGKVCMCKRVLKEQTSPSEEIPFYKISTFGGKADTFISRKLYNEYKTKYSYPKKGDVLISAAGTIGKTVIYNGEDAFFQDSNIVWIDNDESMVLNDYLYYYYKTNPWKVTSGSTIQRLYNDNISGAVITFPKSIDVQKQLISVLKILDEKIKNNNAISSQLESLAKTIYDYWFLQFEFPNEDGKPYKSSGGKMIWNEELKREIPEGWNTTTIGDITINHDSERIPLASKERSSMQGRIPYYGATGIMGYVNRAIFKGDYVLLAEDGSVMDENGYPIIQRISGETWVNNHAHVLEPANGYHCRLLMMILKHVPVVLIKTGSIQMKINQENMNKYHVLNIPDKLKSKANSIFDNIDAELLRINDETNQLTSLRDFLLPMLMNGQVTFKEDA